MSFQLQLIVFFGVVLCRIYIWPCVRISGTDISTFDVFEPYVHVVVVYGFYV